MAAITVELEGGRVAGSAEVRVTHVGAAEAASRGRALRAAVPRSAHAAWEPPAQRRSPVDILAEQATSRDPDLVPIRHGRRMASPFTFYRGAAAIMAADLAGTPVSGLRVADPDGRHRDFYVRQLWDGKASVDPAVLTATTLALYGRICGWTLARAHARSGDRMAIASYPGTGRTFDRAVTDFAVAYADQNERDYAEFTSAVKNGALPAEVGL